jgi:hypothetical protein
MQRDVHATSANHTQDPSVIFMCVIPVLYFMLLTVCILVTTLLKHNHAET